MAEKVIGNRYSGKCLVCGKVVLGGEGIAILDGRWKVSHLECSPVLADKFIQEREARKAQELEKLAREAMYEAIRQERAKVLRQRLGVVYKPLGTVLRQGAWVDETTWDYSYTGEGTIQEFIELLETGRDVGVALRKSTGLKVVGLNTEKKRVSLYECVILSD